MGVGIYLSIRESPNQYQMPDMSYFVDVAHRLGEDTKLNSGWLS